MCIELKEKNQTLVAKEQFFTADLQEARQELIKVTRKVIGVKRIRGDQVLWNFREKKRATLCMSRKYSFNMLRTFSCTVKK
ncbi:hypothetical protein MKX03_011316 [Papaver bracteatum]|nr:hypothetical protein MKX03_011316 [Papaver bracteatum]